MSPTAVEARRIVALARVACSGDRLGRQACCKLGARTGETGARAWCPRLMRALGTGTPEERVVFGGRRLARRRVSGELRRRLSDAGSVRAAHPRDQASLLPTTVKVGTGPVPPEGAVAPIEESIAGDTHMNGRKGTGYGRGKAATRRFHSPLTGFS